MKKIFNMVLTAAFLVAVSVMSTSCLILVDDEMLDFELEVSTETPVRNVDPKVYISNGACKSGKDACYISEVYLSKSSNSEWVKYWEADSHVDPIYADSNINFKVEPGRYFVCVRVVYPNMSKCYDYYDDVCTDVSYKFNYNTNYTFKFDGDSLFKN